MFTDTATAGVWVNGQHTTSDGKVAVDLNWSNASGVGQYRIYYDDDNTPFWGGGVVYTSQKPFTLAGLEPCTTYEIAVERKKYHRLLWKVWYTWPRDTPNVTVTTIGIGGEFCGHSASATRRAITLGVDLSNIDIDELRFCIVNSRHFNPANLATECEINWPQRGGSGKLHSGISGFSV